MHASTAAARTRPGGGVPSRMIPPSPPRRNALEPRSGILCPVLSVRNISKTFPAVQALKGVDLDFKAGEIHGVIGENGAGKSTLMKILAGTQRPDTGGEMTLDGVPFKPRSVRMATDAGVAMIHQELNLVQDLSVADNILLGRERARCGVLDRRRTREIAEAAIDLVGARLEPRTRVGDLPVAMQQMVEIAKAVSQEAGVLIFDEPTAVLSERETTLLFDLMGRLRDDGVAIIYISHLLPEVLELCDRISVLRDGRLVAETSPAEADAARLASLMVGRDLDDVYPDRRSPKERTPRLSIRNLSVPGHVDDVSLEVSPGEIVGLAGLVGSGRTELAEAVVGIRRRTGGEVRLYDTPTQFRSAGEALRAGVAYVSEDRKGRGILTDLSSIRNVTLPNLRAYGRVVPRRRLERRSTIDWIDRLDVRCPDPGAPISTLSGGNQQKFAVASRLDAKPSVLILDEPTRGVDVGAKRELYHLISELAAEGLACMVISSELPELIGLCHRIGVLRTGRLAGVLDTDDVEPSVLEEDIMKLAAGIDETTT